MFKHWNSCLSHRVGGGFAPHPFGKLLVTVCSKLFVKLLVWLIFGWFNQYFTTSAMFCKDLVGFENIYPFLVKKLFQPKKIIPIFCQYFTVFWNTWSNSCSIAVQRYICKRWPLVQAEHCRRKRRREKFKRADLPINNLIGTTGPCWNKMKREKGSCLKYGMKYDEIWNETGDVGGVGMGGLVWSKCPPAENNDHVGDYCVTDFIQLQKTQFIRSVS